MSSNRVQTPSLMSLGIPTNFGAVAGVAAASFAVHHVYMAMRVSNARKKCASLRRDPDRCAL
jgi:hypothetical protein